MTHIEKILSDVGNCAWEKEQLGAYIDTLEKALKEARAENKKMAQRVAQFDRLKENFRVYREKHVPANR